MTLDAEAPAPLLRPGVRLLGSHAAIVLFFAHLFLFNMGTAVHGQTTVPSLATTNYITFLQGSVEIQKAGETVWRAAALKQILATGDRLRTGEKSRAQIYLATGMIHSVGEFAEIQFSGTTTAIRRGIFRIFSREKQPGATFELPSATAALRGTEILIRIFDNGAAEVAVYEGEVHLSNRDGEVLLQAGQTGMSVQGRPPTAMRLDLRNPAYAQWSFYYPGVLNLNELTLPDALKLPEEAYRAGNFNEAVSTYDWNRSELGDDEKIFRANLLLAFGELEETARLLESISATAKLRPVVEFMVAAAAGTTLKEPSAPSSTSEMLALAYYHQGRADLPRALHWAETARRAAPEFAFAHSRAAELHFSFGRNRQALEAIRTSLQYAPLNAHAMTIKGFLLSALNQFSAAFAEFDRAINIDGAYANAWLGRGLIYFRLGELAAGRRDLLVAAALEPSRSILRSYLGKGFEESKELDLSLKELEIAKMLDAKDPTPSLYAALIEHLSGRINRAIRSLEHAQTLNTHRAIFRSSFLLDQDEAVRSANLAVVYQEAGMINVAVREASHAVQRDYGNFSAHLFLANSYNALRDPALADLRYETAAVNEYLVANLLAPAGAARLSPQLSQQEYSRLFERNRFGLSYSGVYISDGDWSHQGVQFGNVGQMSYAVEGTYRSLDTESPTQKLEQETASVQFKQSFGSGSEVYLQAVYSRLSSGDTGQKFDPEADTNRDFESTGEQLPNIFAGYHHEWNPGSHSLFLISHLEDETSLGGTIPRIGTYSRGVDTISRFPAWSFDLDSQNRFRAVVAEAQQIWQTSEHTLVAGTGWQRAELASQQGLHYTGSSPIFSDIYTGAARDQFLEGDLQRYKLYAYDFWNITEPLWLTAGLAYDHLSYPDALSNFPATREAKERSQLSPKAGLLWQPHQSTTFRVAYTHSLGGLLFENSVRLEPTQVGGFNQAYRSIFPELVSGRIPAARMRAFNVGGDSKFQQGTYLGWQAELLESDGDRSIGIFEANQTPAVASRLVQETRFRERALGFYFNQLLGEYFSAGVDYRISRAELRRTIPELAPYFANVSESTESTLQRIGLTAHFNHPSGIFLVAEGTGYHQRLQGGEENVVQLSAYAGYRFPRRRAELRLGILNINDQNYRLDPLNTYPTLPRGRRIVANLRINL